jgi:DNA-binding transcriptional ArsR family regulator
LNAAPKIDANKIDANMMDAAAALAALADPTRRQIFERLAAGPRAVGDIARGLPVTRPAVSQHLAVLKSAGLVKDQAAGTRRIYEIDPKGLGTIRAWLDQFWDTALAAFKNEVEGPQDTPRGES